MLRWTRFFICMLLGLSSLLGSCVPEYKTDLAQLCSDGRTDGDETDVDCGGSCRACDAPRACGKDADCTTSTCVSGRCYDATCRDLKLDNSETDIDCGGDTCPACKATLQCAKNSDCANGNPCLGGICYDASCNNGKKDNDETDVDCGGLLCPACALLKGCEHGSDCKIGNLCLDKLTHSVIEGAGEVNCGDAGVCSSSGVCYSATCTNGNLDVSETDIDCGGETCPPCAAGSDCIQNSDCKAGNTCIGNVCYVDTCIDGKLDGTETDKDCGGPQCPVCTTGKNCTLASDCQASTPCTAGKCGDPMCFNKLQEPSETDLDCGGTCAPCGLNKKCVQHSDCELLNCSNGGCAPPTCFDTSKNQGESDTDCGDLTNLCKRCETGSACTDNANCVTNHCLAGFCVMATCEDGILNGNETAKDCGGSCKKCPDDSLCSQPTDCINAVCKGGVCKAPSCNDGATNGLETGKDCGGSCLVLVSPPKTCPNGEGCNTNADCTFNNCAAGICQPPTCANGQFDSTSETDKDCGGGCSPCADTLKCLTDVDCQSKVCDTSASATSKICVAASCADRAQNGNETDVNCGGVTCTQRCTTGQQCIANSDCLSKVCDAATSKCQTPSCEDKQINGSETGPDCGGSCALMSLPTGAAKTCGTGLGCNIDDDCTSKNCCTAATCQGSINTCVAPGCHDGKKNQGESGIDCGGDAATTGCEVRCTPGQGCQYNSDCDSGVCGPDKTCAVPKCDDLVKNGTEMGKDCGSAACSKVCPIGTPCTGPGDCDSGVCALDLTNVMTCAVPTCFDAVQNGNETALNCGGDCVKKCIQGQGCKIKADCDPSVANIDCIDHACSVPSCKDGSPDGDETDTDCGGTCPDKCADAKKCRVAADCTSNRCVDDGTGTLRCAVPSCTDTTQNQGESGTDCGGTSICTKCDTGLGCTQKSDCTSGVCGSNNLCAAPTCGDTAQNQGETDLDCGGLNCRSATTACDNGKRCVENADCKELWCTTPTGGTTPICVHPTCTDTKQNGSESDIDCGGTCTTKCLDTYKCNKDSDCANGWCHSGKCATPACTDTFKNGTETGNDCGGNCAASCSTAYDANCKQCADGSGCGANNDCKSLNCATNVCAAPPTSGTVTPAICVGRVLDGTTCTQCDTDPSHVTPAYCRTYLWCMYLNQCNPGTVSAPADCVSGAKNGVCSVNKIGKTQDALNAAINAYRCACP